MAAKKKNVEIEETEVSEDSPKKSGIDAALNSDTIQKIRKKYGANLLMKASDYSIVKTPRIPTGIFQMDHLLGGGFPVGRIHLVWGPKSSAKTTGVLKAIAAAQNMCANCWVPLKDCKCKSTRETVAAYFDVEGTFDSEWATKLGVDNSRLLLSVPDYGEQVFDMAEGILRDGGVDIIAIDSLAFLTPAKEIEEEVAKDLMGVQPRLIGKGIRKFVSAINSAGNESGRRPTVFLTNQVRHKMVLYGSPDTTPGGFAPGFAATTEIKTGTGKYTLDEKINRPLHVDLPFRIEKNKSSCAKGESTYRLILTDTETKKMGDVYDEDYILKEARRTALCTGGGASWNLLGRNFRKLEEIEDAIVTDKEFSAELRKTLMELLLAI